VRTLSYKRATGAALAVGLAVSLLLAASPAQAATVAPPHATNIIIAIGGSDTTQDVMNDIVSTANGDYNIKVPPNIGPTPFNVPADANCGNASYFSTANLAANPPVYVAPFGSGEGRMGIRDSVKDNATFPGGAQNATNGNGTLHGCLDVGRSSGPPSAAQDGNGLPGVGTPEYYAFALDAVQVVTGSLLAPASLTQQQVKDIFACTAMPVGTGPGQSPTGAANNWAAFGGGNGPILRVPGNPNSGTVQFFKTHVLGLASGATMPAVDNPPTGNNGPEDCPAALVQSQDTGGNTVIFEENAGNQLLFNDPDWAQFYQQAILPYSMGKYVQQATNFTNPTVDKRAGMRVIGQIRPTSFLGNTPMYGVRWTGSAFLLNNATVNGDVAAVSQFSDANVTGTILSPDTTVDTTAPRFAAGDIGKTLEGTCVAGGTVITGFTSSTQVTISPGSIFTATNCSLKMGAAVVSDRNPQVCLTTPCPAGFGSSNQTVFAGARFVNNIVNSSAPNATEARNLVGFQDQVGGLTSPLCNGNFANTIRSNGFLDLPKLDSTGGATAVACRRVQ
jgi:ABC-type phosphate transport system substrate-binding protein